jgi:hypothetical protein
LGDQELRRYKARRFHVQEKVSRREKVKRRRDFHLGDELAHGTIGVDLPVMMLVNKRDDEPRRENQAGKKQDNATLHRSAQ